MTTSTKKCILSNGLCILNVKKKTKEIALLAVTDFNNTGKLIFDTVEKKIVGSSLKLNPSDNSLIDNFIKDSEKDPIKEVATPAVEA